jgi:hypothetical protein
MKLDVTAVTYSVHARWGARAETSEEIAARFGRYLDTLAAIDPMFALWRVGLKKGRLYEKVRDDLVALVQADISRDDSGESCWIEGYDLIASAREKRPGRHFGMNGKAGSAIRAPDANDIWMKTSWGEWPDPAVIDYALFKAILLTTVDCWQPTVCDAHPFNLVQHYEQVGLFHDSWILYVPPDLAGTVQPPDVPVVEPAPDGGLILAATTEPFTVDNPVHLEAARKIGQATAHLNVALGLGGKPPRQLSEEESLPPDVLARIQKVRAEHAARKA